MRFSRSAAVHVARLLAGALPILTFPAPNLSWLAWFALVPGLVLMIRARTTRSAAVCAWWFGAGYLIAGLYWLVPEIGPGLLLIGIVFGATWMPFGAAARHLLRPPVTVPRTAAAAIVLPSCWILAEWVRSWRLFGGPWAVLGAGQWQHPAVLVLAAWGGMWLVGAAIVLTDTGIVLAAVSIRPRWFAPAGTAARIGRPVPKSGVLPPILAASAVMVGIGAGPLLFALASPPAVAETETIALVQPGDQDTSRGEDSLTAALAGSASGDPRPDLIVWGESSVAGTDLDRDPALLERIRALSAAAGADILVDQDAVVSGIGKQKMAVLVNAQGVQGTYVKNRLVPFGEYIPFRRYLGWLTSISRAAPRDTVPGIGPHLLSPTDRAGRTLPIGVLICFESTFPDMSRMATNLGAHLIVYQTATVTFQGTWGPDQHAALAAVRAAETGRPVVQAALTGDSAAFDAQGRRLAWLSQSEHGVIIASLRIPPQSDRTPYDRLGDYIPWTAVVVTAATVILAARSAGFPA
ncbi:apolipoprotein N-acyltransferase [Nocardia sp. GAS34]|uniref:apolipoprotein N-acyltransferase n=1 Tax=unclassified Nocardia TaxID=2637762 RepID=UPI003D1BA1F0